MLLFDIRHPSPDAEHNITALGYYIRGESAKCPVKHLLSRKKGSSHGVSRADSFLPRPDAFFKSRRRVWSGRKGMASRASRRSGALGPHRESFNRCARRWSIRTDSRYMNTRRHRKMCTRARRITPNAGLVGNCSPIPGILTRPDPPPASKRASRSYGEGPCEWGSWGTSGGYPSVRVRCVPITALNVFDFRLFA